MQLDTILTDRDLGAIADDLGIEIQGDAGRRMQRGRSAGMLRYRLVLRPDKTTRDPETGDCRYQRESASYFSGGRRVHAVCWHGHADFMTAVYQRDPKARFETAFATYSDRADFARNYVETAFRNVGAPIAPVSAASACRCGFTDTADHRLGGVFDNVESETV